MQRFRTVLGWWLLAVAAVGGAVAAWWARSIPTVVGSAVVAVVAAVGGVLSKRGTQILEDNAGRSLEMREKLLRDRSGRLPRVREITDLVAIGVHRAGTSAFGPVPEFVRRDLSDELEAVLGRVLFVLVVGESTAGKSRAAFEAAQVVLPDHRFVLPDPDDRSSLRAASAAAERERRCESGWTISNVIWGPTA